MITLLAGVGLIFIDVELSDEKWPVFSCGFYHAQPIFCAYIQISSQLLEQDVFSAYIAAEKI